jgi:hypothetical protein
MVTVVLQVLTSFTVFTSVDYDLSNIIKSTYRSFQCSLSESKWYIYIYYWVKTVTNLFNCKRQLKTLEHNVLIQVTKMTGEVLIDALCHGQL